MSMENEVQGKSQRRSVVFSAVPTHHASPKLKLKWRMVRAEEKKEMTAP